MISDKMVEAAFRSEMPDALSRVISRRHIRALLTAALSAASCNCPGEGSPAASGAHPDALPDGTLSKSTAKRVEVLAAASVSERARDMVTALYGDKAVFTRHDVARALEQALTQQRDTTPQPSADAARDGICSLLGRVRPGSEAAPWVVRELESLLSAASGEKGGVG